ncbi:MAG: (2Fe-2S)-binding protein [Bdellovibrionaceae bacterium]|nr:(2Fe-2S)-binding protein [Bdellovibrionales bacterium]MCB9085346.1 (2Fe-2S)-binding protein [Pseudobdellovibrionaceae bacterium]
MFSKRPSAKTTASITFLPGGKVVEIKGFSTVLDVALGNKIDLSHSCDGMGSCTTCRVVVEEAPDGQPPRTEVEMERAEERGYSEHERLACQLEPRQGMVIRIPQGR